MSLSELCTWDPLSPKDAIDAVLAGEDMANGNIIGGGSNPKDSEAAED